MQAGSGSKDEKDEDGCAAMENAGQAEEAQKGRKKAGSASGKGGTHCVPFVRNDSTIGEKNAEEKLEQTVTIDPLLYVNWKRTLFLLPLLCQVMGGHS